MKQIYSFALISIALVSCDKTTSSPPPPATPIGFWQRSDRGVLVARKDSATFKYTLALGADSVGTWKKYLNDTLNKAFQGKWTLVADTISINVKKCSDAESMSPAPCEWFFDSILSTTVSDSFNLRFRWAAEQIEELYLPNTPHYTRSN